MGGTFARSKTLVILGLWVVTYYTCEGSGTQAEEHNNAQSYA